MASWLWVTSSPPWHCHIAEGTAPDIQKLTVWGAWSHGIPPVQPNLSAVAVPAYSSRFQPWYLNCSNRCAGNNLLDASRFVKFSAKSREQTHPSKQPLWKKCLQRGWDTWIESNLIKRLAASLSDRKNVILGAPPGLPRKIHPNLGPQRVTSIGTCSETPEAAANGAGCL